MLEGSGFAAWPKDQKTRPMTDRIDTRAGGGVRAAVLVSVLILGGVATYLFKIGQDRSFPELAPGGYIGTVSGIRPGVLYVDCDTTGRLLRVARITEDGPVSEVAEAIPSGEGRIQPIPLNGGVLTGVRIGEGSYRGELRDRNGASAGEWQLTRLSQEIVYGEIPQDLKLWLLLRGERAQVQRAIQSAEKRVPLQKSEIERLNSYLADGVQLKERARERLQQAERKVEAAEKALSEKRAQLKSLEDRHSIALRVTPMGKLVNLARESLEREARWARSMNRTPGSGGSAQLLRELARAEKVEELLKLLDLERQSQGSVIEGAGSADL